MKLTFCICTNLKRNFRALCSYIWRLLYKQDVMSWSLEEISWSRYWFKAWDTSFNLARSLSKSISHLEVLRKILYRWCLTPSRLSVIYPSPRKYAPDVSPKDCLAMGYLSQLNINWSRSRRSLSKWHDNRFSCFNLLDGWDKKKEEKMPSPKISEQEGHIIKCAVVC